MTPTESSTIFLLQFDASSPSAWTDSGPGRRKPAQLGSIVGATASAKFGSYAYEYAGSPSGYDAISLGNCPMVGNIPYTLEAFVYQPSSQPSASGAGRFIVCVSSSGTNYPGLLVDTSTGKLKAGAGNSYIQSDAALPTGSWVHVAVTRDDANVSRMFINGVLQSATVTDSTALGVAGSTGSTAIGGQVGNSGTSFVGRLDQVRYLLGVALYTSTFSPPTSAYADAPAAGGASISPPVALRGTGAPASATFKAYAAPKQIRDTYYGGSGKVSGQVVIKGFPDVPVRRRVRLFRDRDGACVRESFSDATTGAYLFTNVDPTVRYTVIAYDDTHSYRAVIADNLTPDPM